MSLVEASNVVVDFQEKSVVALNNFSLTIGAREFVSVVGPSGCGKTTFLKCVAGLIKPSSGSISIDKKTIEGPGPERGMVFQEFGLFPWRTVMGNVEYPLEVRGVSREKRRSQCKRLIDLVGLKGFEDSYSHQLSGGMKQRVGIARALSIEPKVLLMDEPFANVDVQTRTFLQEELLRILARVEMTVLFVTHDIEEAIFLGDRVIVSTARPGRVKAVMEVDIPRPRNFQTRVSERFVQLRVQVWEMLREELAHQMEQREVQA